MGDYGKHYERFDDSKTKRIIWVDVDCVVIKGSICIVKNYEGEAQLRLFGTEPSLQRLGIGTQLMQKEMDFCKEKGYRHIFCGLLKYVNQHSICMISLNSDGRIQSQMIHGQGI